MIEDILDRRLIQSEEYKEIIAKNLLLNCVCENCNRRKFTGVRYHCIFDDNAIPLVDEGTCDLYELSNL